MKLKKILIKCISIGFSVALILAFGLQPLGRPESTTLANSIGDSEDAADPKQDTGVKKVEYYSPPPTLREANNFRRVDQSLAIAIKMEKYEYKVLEPIRILVEIENKSKNHVVFSGSGFSIYNVFHPNVYQQGLLVPKTRYHGRPTVPSTGRIVGSLAAKPGGKCRSHLTVNLVNDMTEVGTYSFFIEAETGDTVEIDGRRIPVVARSHEITVKIIDLPRLITFDGIDEGQ